jgi:hypothetical protein
MAIQLNLRDINVATLLSPVSIVSETKNEPEYNEKGERVRKYYPPPPFLYTTFEYQDVGTNMKYRTEVTDFFYQKVLKWIQSYKEFSHLKKHLPFLKSNEGFKYIYELLRLFTKKSNINWFDLRDNYPVVKDFLRFRIGNV